MNSKAFEKVALPSICIVALGSLVCLGLAFWMSQVPAMTASNEGKEMFQALNFAWKCGFGAIAGMLVWRNRDTVYELRQE